MFPAATRESRNNPTAAPVYQFAFQDGKLSEKPLREFKHRLPANRIYWSGPRASSDEAAALRRQSRHASRPRATSWCSTRARGERVAELPTDIHPYAVRARSRRATRCSFPIGAARSVSVIDTNTRKTRATIRVGHNPNDMVLAPDGRLFVACGNENSVYVLDTKTMHPIEVISTAMYKMAPVGSTPNALALDATGQDAVRRQCRQQQRRA